MIAYLPRVHQTKKKLKIPAVKQLLLLVKVVVVVVYAFEG